MVSPAVTRPAGDTMPARDDPRPENDWRAASTTPVLAACPMNRLIAEPAVWMGPDRLVIVDTS